MITSKTVTMPLTEVGWYGEVMGRGSGHTDGHADCANGVDNCHDASANGLEDTFNLCEC
jgi:hypothetical protein